MLDYSQREREGTLVEINDKRAYISTDGLTIVPQAGDVVVLSGSTYSVVSVSPLNPGGTVVYYEAQLRR